MAAGRAGWGDVSKPVFTQSQIEAIAGALGDTADGLTGAEISHLLATCGIADPTPEMAKRHRLYNAFAQNQNARQDRTRILGFIRHAMKPERFTRSSERFEPMRANLNQTLAFAGLCVDEGGTLQTADKVRTLSEAQRRAQELRVDLTARGVHPDVLRFCKAELLADDYFHAVLEAVKSIADKIREKTGLTDDGGALVDHALTGSPPMLAVNPLATETHRSEQRGFANLVKGAFGMFRNPTAHEARIHWPIGKDDAEDLLSLVSLIHKRLDASHMPPRVQS